MSKLRQDPSWPLRRPTAARVLFACKVLGALAAVLGALAAATSAAVAVMSLAVGG
jgi:hypothetical protein